jgi:hypothetical protein
MTDLHALVYVSRSRLQPGESAFAASMNAILTAARANNDRNGVTGALLFDEVYFAQMLEGPEGAVTSTFERIRGDRRHTDVTMLSFDRASARRLSEWTMAYAGASGVLLPAIGAGRILTSPTMIEAERAGRKIVDLLTTLIRHDTARAALLAC